MLHEHCAQTGLHRVGRLLDVAHTPADEVVQVRLNANPKGDPLRQHPVEQKSNESPRCWLHLRIGNILEVDVAHCGQSLV